MKTLIKASLLSTIVVLWAGSAAPLWGATPILIFDNSVNDLLTRFNPGTLEVGDQIKLEMTDPYARYLTDFSFEYWGLNTISLSSFSGTVQARVQFYKNNGLAQFNGYSTPNDMFWQSAWFTLAAPTVRSTLDYSVAGGDFPSGGLFIPVNEMTWSVQFRGMGATDTVGVDIYSPPVVGSDYPDYWENNGGWKLMTNNVGPMNFAARMQATPEPSTLTLSILGGLSILTLARRLRRKE